MKLVVKFSFILLLFISQFSFAQKKEAKIKERMWGDTFEGFNQTEVPEKWKNESVVILCRSFDYEIKKEIFMTYLYEDHYFRERIKLNDNAAVKKYSDFDFGTDYGMKGFFATTSSKRVYAGIKIIKPNGKEIEIDLDDAIAKELSLGSHKVETKSIAIPGLEPGDIIDYYYCEKKTLTDNVFEKFKDNYIYLVDKYPILKQRVNLHIMRKCYLNAKSVNGAPKLKISNKSTNNEMIYSVIDENREKADIGDIRWLNPNTELPMIKFEAYYASSKGKKHYDHYAIFLGKSKKIKSSISKTEILDYVNYATHWPSEFERIMNNKTGKYIDKTTYKSIKKNMKSNFKKERNPEKLAKEAYYYFRQLEYRNAYERDILYNKDYSYGLNDLYFVRNMSKYLEKMKIKHEIIVTYPRFETMFKDMLLYNELVLMIKVNTKEPFYLCNFNRYSHYKDINPSYQGNKAYHINFSKKRKERRVTNPKSPIPIAAAGNSADLTKLDVKISSSDMQELIINRNVELTGSIKNNYQTTITTPYEYLGDSKNDQYNTNFLITESRSKKDKRKLKERIAEKENQDNIDRKKRVEKLIKDEYDLNDDVEVESIQVINTGLWDENPILKYSTSFKLKNEFVKKVGLNYLIEIGKLIGYQVDLNENEIERSYDIYFPYARIFENEITFTIPDGYKVNGIEKLEYNVTNDYSAFTSSAKIISNTIVIKTKKVYKTNFVKSENWKELVKFLNAANDFYEQKILLEKTK